MSDTPQHRSHVGFIGLGTMGTPMAMRIIAAGYSLTVYNRTPSHAQALVDRGAVLAQTPLQLAQASDVVIVMVSDDAALDAVVSAETGILPAIHDGKALINMSTVSPGIVERLNSTVTARGGVFLDAPVSGSRIPAEQGTLVILCGGEQRHVDAYSALLLTMGKKILYAGNAGMGTRMKLTANLLLGGMMGLLSEAYSFGTANGISPELLFEMIGASPLSSPLYALKAQNVLHRDFTPAFPLKHQYKDLNLILGVAEKLHLGLPLTQAADDLFGSAVAEGKGDLDMSAVVAAGADRTTG